jgi:hypothetical protein
MNHLITYTLTGLAALVLSTAHLLDAPSELQAAIDTAAAVQDAHGAMLADAKFAKAAQAVCGGENSAWKLRDDGLVQCFTHRGYKTTTVKVAP